MESRMEEYLNAAISGDTKNLPKPISRIDFLLCELIKTLGESGASIEEVEKIVTDKVAEIVADAPEDFDTLKELSDWIYTHEESAAAMNTAIQSNTNSIESLMTDVNKKANSDDVYDKATADSRFLGIDDTASNSYRWGNILNEMGTQNDSDTWLLVLNKDRVQHRLSTDFAGSAVTDEKFANVRNDIAINRTTLGTQCKNLLNVDPSQPRFPFPTGSNISSGVITLDNCVLINDGYYRLGYGFKTEIGKKYTISLNNDCTIIGYVYLDGTYDKSSASDLKGYGNTISVNCSYTFTATQESTVMNIRSRANQTITGVIKPMLRYADITDDTYEPYKENIDERLIQNKSDIALNKTTLGYQCKNLLKNTASTKIVSGITFTVNNDKSVTANGTNSTSNYANIIVFKGKLEAGTYTLTGAVSDAFRIRLGVGTTEDGYGSYVGVDKGNGYTFTVAEKALYTVTCQVESGKTASNVIFKPMLRYADIMDDTYEEYQPSLQEQISALISRIEALEV